LPVSAAERFLSGPALESHIKMKEADQKLAAATVQRLNTLIKAIGNLR